MPKPRAYIETTIPSFYYDPRLDPEIVERRQWTRLWWDQAVDEYLKHKLMPAVPPYDAWHLALASFHHCDFIVTWNCKHLANPNKAPHVARINASLGLYVPKLATPRDLLGRKDE
jgi:hypothetical protein